MTFFEKVFGGSHADDTQKDDLHCRHASLSPMWENIEEMGESDKISRYRCLDCGVFLAASSAPQDAERAEATSAASSQERRQAA